MIISLPKQTLNEMSIDLVRSASRNEIRVIAVDNDRMHWELFRLVNQDGRLASYRTSGLPSDKFVTDHEGRIEHGEDH